MSETGFSSSQPAPPQLARSERAAAGGSGRGSPRALSLPAHGPAYRAMRASLERRREALQKAVQHAEVEENASSDALPLAASLPGPTTPVASEVLAAPREPLPPSSTSDLASCMP